MAGRIGIGVAPTVIYFVLYLAVNLLLFKLAYFGFSEFDAGRESLVLDIVSSSPIVMWDLFLFFFVVLILYLVPFLLIVKSTNSVSRFLRFSSINRYSYFIISLSAMVLAVLALNQIIYPRSAYSVIFPLLSGGTVTIAIGLISAFIFLVMVVIPVSICFVSRVKDVGKYRISLVVTVPLLAVAAAQGIPNNAPLVKHGSEQPDIIVIGLDSITSMHLTRYPDKHVYLKSLLNSGVTFTNALTPLARTFPAWVSILSGEYPVNSGARYNLVPLKDVNHSPDLLPKILKQKGYYTIYAQDERRFNNIDESFGFDTVIGPKVGASEFILTKISDIPLVNLALLLPGASNVFPQIAGNRADHVHYSPHFFPQAILEGIPKKREYPIFLAAHFCLAHFPYSWRDHEANAMNLDQDSEHQIALSALEQQIKVFLEGLEARGRLDNAVMVILSDHGESLGYENGLWLDAKKGDRDYSRVNGEAPPITVKSTYNGHGTNVLSRTQYSVLLSFVGWGEQAALFPPEKRSLLASLTDVLPSLLFKAGMDIPENIDGRNLFEPLPGKNDSAIAITETGIVFSSLTTLKYIDKKEVLREARQFYTVDPDTGRMILRPEKIDALVSKKNYSSHTEDWMLALIRRKAADNVAVLVHKPSGRWTIGGDAALIKSAPLLPLGGKLQEMFGEEIDDFMHSWPFKK
ncbi:sulfatase-like hydrolase/transferase [Thiolapillus sp.]